MDLHHSADYYLDGDWSTGWHGQPMYLPVITALTEGGTPMFPHVPG